MRLHSAHCAVSSARLSALLAGSAACLAGLTGLALVATPRIAQADTLVVTGSAPLTTTNFSSTISFARFNPSLGTLTSIGFSLTGNVQGTVFFENQGNTPATVTSNLQALLTLTRPDGTTLAAAQPTVTTTSNVTAFDGVIDYGGTSGRTVGGQGSATSTTTLTSAADRALFTGNSNVTLPLTGTGQSGATGAANLTSQSNTVAGADLSVTYTFTPNAVTAPEPGSLALLLPVLGMVGIVIRKHRKN